MKNQIKCVSISVIISVALTLVITSLINNSSHHPSRNPSSHSEMLDKFDNKIRVCHQKRDSSKNHPDDLRDCLLNVHSDYIRKLIVLIDRN